MKALPQCHQTASSDLSNQASTSKCDQEMGSGNAIPSNRDVSTTKLDFFRCFWHGIDPTTLCRMVVAEAVGTFILMFSISGIMASMQLLGGQVGLLEYAATAGLAVIVVVVSIGSISGAHVNPAVTIAFATVGPFPWSRVPLYILAQIGGSVLATYVGKMVYGIKAELMISRPLNGCTEAFWVELIVTFFIVFLAASLSNDAHSRGHLTGIVVGVAIGLGVLISGPVSGGSMNPARSLGPAIVAGKLDYTWIYIVAPTVGAVAGALLYRAIRLQGWSCHSSSLSPNTNQLLIQSD